MAHMKRTLILRKDPWYFAWTVQVFVFRICWYMLVQYYQFVGHVWCCRKMPFEPHPDWSHWRLLCEIWCQVFDGLGFEKFIKPLKTNLSYTSKIHHLQQIWGLLGFLVPWQVGDSGPWAFEEWIEGYHPDPAQQVGVGAGTFLRKNVFKHLEIPRNGPNMLDMMYPLTSKFCV